MILVDSSVWIHWLGDRSAAIEEGDLMDLATCGPVLQEVIQGLRQDPLSVAFRADLLALPVLSDPVPSELFIAAADLYSSGRRRGITIRSSVDCLIAAIAIHNSVPVWHRDRDFDAISSFTNLQILRRPPLTGRWKM